jgi:hypothetical protein
MFEEGRHAIEKVKPRMFGCQRGWRWQPGKVRLHVRDDGRNPCCFSAHFYPDALRLTRSEIGANNLYPGPERRRPCLFHTPANQDTPSTGARQGGKLQGSAGFPNASFTREQDQPTMTSAGRLKTGQQGGYLCLPAYKGRFSEVMWLRRLPGRIAMLRRNYRGRFFVCHRL